MSDSDDSDIIVNAKLSRASTSNLSSQRTKQRIVSSESEENLTNSDCDDSECCAICLGRIKGSTGSPDAVGCDHYFCLLCILEWAKNNASCPQDRRHFNKIIVKSCIGGNIIERIPVESKKEEEKYNTIEENPTFCEICGSCEREECLLLCDGCDLGWHLECLTPPLSEVPIEEWFCPFCVAAGIPTVVGQNIVHATKPVVVESTSELATRRQSSARSGARRIPRTRETERILQRITKERKRERKRKKKRSRYHNSEIPSLERVQLFTDLFHSRPKVWGSISDTDIDAAFNEDPFADKLLSATDPQRFSAKASAISKFKTGMSMPKPDYLGRSHHPNINESTTSVIPDLLSNILDNQNVLLSKDVLISENRTLSKKSKMNGSSELNAIPLPSQRNRYSSSGEDDNDRKSSKISSERKKSSSDLGGRDKSYRKKEDSSRRRSRSKDLEKSRSYKDSKTRRSRSDSRDRKRYRQPSRSPSSRSYNVNSRRRRSRSIEDLSRRRRSRSKDKFARRLPSNFGEKYHSRSRSRDKFSRRRASRDRSPKRRGSRIRSRSRDKSPKRRNSKNQSREEYSRSRSSRSRSREKSHKYKSPVRVKSPKRNISKSPSREKSKKQRKKSSSIEDSPIRVIKSTRKKIRHKSRSSSPECFKTIAREVAESKKAAKAKSSESPSRNRSMSPGKSKSKGLPKSMWSNSFFSEAFSLAEETAGQHSLHSMDMTPLRSTFNNKENHQSPSPKKESIESSPSSSSNSGSDSPEITIIPEEIISIIPEEIFSIIPEEISLPKSRLTPLNNIEDTLAKMPLSEKTADDLFKGEKTPIKSVASNIKLLTDAFINQTALTSTSPLKMESLSKRKLKDLFGEDEKETSKDNKVNLYSDEDLFMDTKKKTYTENFSFEDMKNADEILSIGSQNADEILSIGSPASPDSSSSPPFSPCHKGDSPYDPALPGLEDSPLNSQNLGDSPYDPAMPGMDSPYDPASAGMDSPYDPDEELITSSPLENVISPPRSDTSSPLPAELNSVINFSVDSKRKSIDLFSDSDTSNVQKLSPSKVTKSSSKTEKTGTNKKNEKYFTSQEDSSLFVDAFDAPPKSPKSLYTEEDVRNKLREIDSSFDNPIYDRLFNPDKFVSSFDQSQSNDKQIKPPKKEEPGIKIKEIKQTDFNSLIVKKPELNFDEIGLKRHPTEQQRRIEAADELKKLEPKITKIELEAKVVKEANKYLYPFYHDKCISKQVFKEIMEKIVRKVLEKERSATVKADKIHKLVNGYVQLHMHQLKKKSRR